LFSGDGVVEFKKLGVQEISSIAGEAREIFKRLDGMRRSTRSRLALSWL
jgi:hypothetical protein